MSLALALKYRPTTFEDLIGQHAVSQTLSLALDSKHISHAYLLVVCVAVGKQVQLESFRALYNAIKDLLQSPAVNVKIARLH